VDGSQNLPPQQHDFAQWFTGCYKLEYTVLNANRPISIIVLTKNEAVIKVI
jgi:hypothetical protein